MTAENKNKIKHLYTKAKSKVHMLEWPGAYDGGGGGGELAQLVRAWGM